MEEVLLALGPATALVLLPQASPGFSLLTRLKGDRCETDNDCDGDYICRNSRCAAPGSGGGQTQAPPRPTTSVRRPTTTTSVRRLTTTVYVTASRRPTQTARPTSGGGQSCEWTGHCLNDPCQSETDCDGQLICRSGRCANPASTFSTATRAPTGGGGATRTTFVPGPTTRPGTPACGDNPLACIGRSLWYVLKTRELTRSRRELQN